MTRVWLFKHVQIATHFPLQDVSSRFRKVKQLKGTLVITPGFNMHTVSFGHKLSLLQGDIDHFEKSILPYSPARLINPTSSECSRNGYRSVTWQTRE